MSPVSNPFRYIVREASHQPNNAQQARSRRVPVGIHWVVVLFGFHLHSNHIRSRDFVSQYTVRLTVGEQVVETPVDVRVDPTLDVSATDLQKQFEVTVELRDMLSRVNDALRGLDSIQAQLTDRKRLLETHKASDEIVESIEGEME